MRQENIYHKWSSEELDTLAKGVAAYGHKWKAIQSNLLPHLPVQTIKNKYYASQNKTETEEKTQVRSTRKDTASNSDDQKQFTREEQNQIISKLTQLLGFM